MSKSNNNYELSAAFDRAHQKLRDVSLYNLSEVNTDNDESQNYSERNEPKKINILLKSI